MGLINNNTYGTPMKIIEIEHYSNVIVEFQDQHKLKVKTTLNNFKKGTVKNPYDITVASVGYLGVGKYKLSENCKNNRVYKEWTNILARCYKEHHRLFFLSYADCYICEEWKCFQNFAEWYDDNYYDIGEGRMHLDKDIICAGNKEYSPDKCIFVPQRINLIFMESKNRKYDLPTGVSYSSNKQKYCVSYGGVPQGTYETLEEAVKVHSREKRKHVKQVADEYKDRIPKKVYDILVNW
jgi:hypothetical protein